MIARSLTKSKLIKTRSLIQFGKNSSNYIRHFLAIQSVGTLLEMFGIMQSFCYKGNVNFDHIYDIFA